MIVCRGIEKRYASVRALNGIDLELDAGEPVGLIGPNGAGKTTLFSILCGFLPADKGVAEIDGDTVGSSSLKGRIGVLPQDASFFKGHKLEPQLRLFARLQGMNSRAASVESDRVMELFEVTDLARRKPEQLSFGQRKRCAMAQAMIGKPSLVLLDEPTSGLDPVAAEEVRQLIRKQSSESTFIISSHNLAELQDICSRVVVMNQGKILINSPLSELLGQQSHLNLLLDTPLEPSSLTEINNHFQLDSMTIDANDNRRVHIQLAENHSKDSSHAIMQELESRGYQVLEFHRGKRLSEEISSLLGQ